MASQAENDRPLLYFKSDWWAFSSSGRIFLAKTYPQFRLCITHLFGYTLPSSYHSVSLNIGDFALNLPPHTWSWMSRQSDGQRGCSPRHCSQSRLVRLLARERMSVVTSIARAHHLQLDCWAMAHSDWYTWPSEAQTGDSVWLSHDLTGQSNPWTSANGPR